MTPSSHSSSTAHDNIWSPSWFKHRHSDSYAESSTASVSCATPTSSLQDDPEDEDAMSALIFDGEVRQIRAIIDAWKERYGEQSHEPCIQTAYQKMTGYTNTFLDVICEMMRPMFRKLVDRSGQGSRHNAVEALVVMAELIWGAESGNITREADINSAKGMRMNVMGQLSAVLILILMMLSLLLATKVVMMCPSSCG